MRAARAARASAFLVSWVVIAAGCGSGSGSAPGQQTSASTTPTPTSTATVTPTPTPDARPALDADAPEVVRECVDRWNASIRRDRRGLGRTIGRIARNQAEPGVAVALYDGPKVAKRRDRCLVMVSKGEVTLPPYSRQRGKAGWLPLCRLVSAENNEKATRRCTPYKRIQEHVGELADDGSIENRQD